MATVTVPVNVQTGTQQLAAIPVPNKLTKITARLARMTTATPTFWTNPLTEINADIYISVDGGLTFQFTKGLISRGGIHVVKGGVEAQFSSIELQLPAGTSRQARAEITVTNGPLISQLTVITA